MLHEGFPKERVASSWPASRDEPTRDDWSAGESLEDSLGNTLEVGSPQPWETRPIDFNGPDGLLLQNHLRQLLAVAVATDKEVKDFQSNADGIPAAQVMQLHSPLAMGVPPSFEFDPFSCYTPGVDSTRRRPPTPLTIQGYHPSAGGSSASEAIIRSCCPPPPQQHAPAFQSASPPPPPCWAAAFASASSMDAIGQLRPR